MVQEFHVLRCFSCQTFQVHQVKKSKKWSCKMCGEKQSLVKVYGRGSGADCRRHVQKLNSLRGELHEAEHAREPEDEEEELKEEGDEALTCENQQGAAGAVSRWSKYLSGAGGGAGPEEGEDEAAEEEENVSMERSAYHGSWRGCTRKAGYCARSAPPLLLSAGVAAGHLTAGRLPEGFAAVPQLRTLSLLNAARGICSTRVLCVWTFSQRRCHSDALQERTGN
ncbi:MRN complex-interacting protein isoform X2 [Anguilla anguilla]|uniref:MRN complex-interacting protein isoform X2 n=1 Tax=Anguilla anguilla TaxID=7936 RepID=UPI0015AC7754|nr:MRN complex-interacting protein isoform X2 [Anguilla anguilla]